MKNTVKHWIHGIREYKVVVDIETNCRDCLHVKVCARNMKERCVNNVFGRTSGTADIYSCGWCWHSFTRFDNDQPIACFKCEEFTLKEYK